MEDSVEMIKPINQIVKFFYKHELWLISHIYETELDVLNAVCWPQYYYFGKSWSGIDSKFVLAFNGK